MSPQPAAFRSRVRRYLASVLISAVLSGALASDADAHLSPTTETSYDLSLLSQQDWRSLEKNFFLQSMRGSMALIFPNRPPITDPKEVENWVKAKGLLGFSLAGLTAGPLANWALAKQFAVANHKGGGEELPVIAVNSGWTDWFATFGHLLEAGTLRAAVNSHRAYRGDPLISGKIAKMIRARQKNLGSKMGPLLIGSHSAGGYYAANVAWLLEAQGQKAATKALRLQSIGLAVNVPKGVRIEARMGIQDMIGGANSSTEAIVSASTKLIDGQAHVNGELWKLGDSRDGNHPWKVTSLSETFDRGIAASLRGKDTAQRSEFFRGRSRKIRNVAKAARKIAEQNRAPIFGVKRLVHANLDYQATELELSAQRDEAVARYLSGDKAAKKDIESINARRRSAKRDLADSVKTARRNILTDSVDFLSYMGGEAATSMNPLKMFSKSMQAMKLMTNVSRNTFNLWRNNPMLNPAGAMFQPLMRRPAKRTAPRPRLK
jgi:hypothetical protein